MSTNNPAPKVSASTLLNSLSQIGGEVGLAIQIGTALIPIGKALVQKIKDASTGVTTITYQLLVQQDQAELVAVDQLSLDDLSAINVELVRQGAKPLPIPGQ